MLDIQSTLTRDVTPCTHGRSLRGTPRTRGDREGFLRHARAYVSAAVTSTPWARSGSRRQGAPAERLRGRPARAGDDGEAAGCTSKAASPPRPQHVGPGSRLRRRIGADASAVLVERTRTRRAGRHRQDCTARPCATWPVRRGSRSAPDGKGTEAGGPESSQQEAPCVTARVHGEASGGGRDDLATPLGTSHRSRETTPARPWRAPAPCAGAAEGGIENPVAMPAHGVSSTRSAARIRRVTRASRADNPLRRSGVGAGVGTQ